MLEDQKTRMMEEKAAKIATMLIIAHQKMRQENEEVSSCLGFRYRKPAKIRVSEVSAMKISSCF